MPMALEIPSKIERDIRRSAEEQHISHEEAAFRLIEQGLAAKRRVTKTVYEQGLGLFGSPEDASLLDDVVSIAYEERRRPSKPEPSL